MSCPLTLSGTFYFHTSHTSNPGSITHPPHIHLISKLSLYFSLLLSTSSYHNSPCTAREGVLPEPSPQQLPDTNNLLSLVQPASSPLFLSTQSLFSLLLLVLHPLQTTSTFAIGMFSNTHKEFPIQTTTPPVLTTASTSTSMTLVGTPRPS